MVNYIAGGQLHSLAVKCKSPEPIQQIETLRRFDLTTPKKNLRGLGLLREREVDLPINLKNKYVSQQKVESQKLGKVGANDEGDLVDDVEEIEDDELLNRNTAHQARA